MDELDYRVELEAYHGPLDLLLFLIKREEVDIHDIPIARITDQYLAYVAMIERINPDAVAEFIVLAATLMEIKSRSLLPQPPIEREDGELVDPRLELVRQLLQYKTYKDAARQLERFAQTQVLRHPRVPVLPEPPKDEVDLEDVQVWDLLQAFQRLLEETGRRGEVFHEVNVDDTPLALHADDILDSLRRRDGRQVFRELFVARTKGEMIGLFLALLELIRGRRVRAIQPDPLGDIELHLLDDTPLYEGDFMEIGQTTARVVEGDADENDDFSDEDDEWDDEAGDADEYDCEDDPSSEFEATIEELQGMERNGPAEEGMKRGDVGLDRSTDENGAAS